MNPIWRAFFGYHSSPAFYADFGNLFGDDMRRLHPALEPRFGMRLEDLPMTNRRLGDAASQTRFQIERGCRFGINSPAQKPTSVRGPHADSHHKFLNALCYILDPEDGSQARDLQIYRYRDGRPAFDGKQPSPEDLEPFALLPYRANIVVMWVGTLAEAVRRRLGGLRADA